MLILMRLDNYQKKKKNCFKFLKRNLEIENNNE